MATLDDFSVLVRRLDVTARLTNSVEELSSMSEKGVLLETLIGRYVLDPDARDIWLEIDGAQNIGEVAEAVAQRREALVGEVLPAVARICRELLDLGLVAIVSAVNTSGSSDTDSVRVSSISHE